MRILFCFFLFFSCRETFSNPLSLSSTFYLLGVTVVEDEKRASLDRVSLLLLVFILSNRSIGGKVSFHNNVVVPSGVGSKRSFLKFPFKCSYKKFGLPGVGNDQGKMQFLSELIQYNANPVNGLTRHNSPMQLLSG